MKAKSEFWEREGIPRAHQKLLVEHLEDAGGGKRLGIREAIAARLREQEVTFNILGAPDGSARPWAIDETPLILDPREFRQLGEGLAQRARLLGAILADLYGEQRILKERLLPEKLVFGNPHYFRACHGLFVGSVPPLVLYAADVARDPDGQFQVYSDRTAAPTGAGYALENRLVVGQALARTFQAYRVRKVNHFFDTVQRELQAISPRREATPRVVLLTPGVRDESSFEHSYLSRYLGIELVEGRDLTVRGDEVFLKTLEGLKKVDVVLRRVSDDYCDPLELREDSMIGVAGLASAVRAGNVAIANQLGAGLVEAPSMKAYLPGLAQALLGEDLALPSVETRYLGDPKQTAEVLDTLGDWIIKQAFSDRRSEVETASLTEIASLERLRRRIASDGESLVAERWPAQSVAPVGDSFLEEGAVSLRLFACRSGNSYEVMPGGLARLRDTPDGVFLTVQNDAVSKDVWVPSLDVGAAPVLPQMPAPPLSIRRGGVDLPSRLFDDIFWLGRYVERAENNARIVRAGLEPTLSEGREVDPRVQDGILKTLLGLEVLERSQLRSTGFERVLLSTLYDPEKPNSVRSLLGRIHSLTSAARSRLSRDAWLVLRRLASVLGEPRMVTLEEAALDLQELLLVLAAVHGIVGSNMVRGYAWMFWEMGRRIERGVFVFTLLSQLFPGDGYRLLMENLLTVCDSLLTYRSRYLSTLQAAPVVDLVLTDETNPQAALFQVRRLIECVRALPRETTFPLSRAEQRLITLETRLLTSDLDRAVRGDAQHLRDLAEEGANLLWQVSDDITQTFFTHAEATRNLALSTWAEDVPESGK